MTYPDFWNTLKTLPDAVIAYDKNNDCYLCNPPAQIIFHLDEITVADAIDLTHLQLFDGENNTELDTSILLPNKHILINSKSILLSLNSQTKLMTLKQTPLPYHELALSICELTDTNHHGLKQQTFDEVISLISTQLIDIHPNNLDEQIEEALQAIGRYCEADRSYFFQFNDDGKSMSNTHEWVNFGIKPFKNELQDIPKQAMPFFFQAMYQRQVFNVSDVERLPAEASAEKAEFIAENIKSILCVGLIREQNLVGFIGCDCVKEARNWCQTDLLRIRLVGDMITSAIHSLTYRQALEQTQIKLLNANKELQQLVNVDSLTNIANRRQFDAQLQHEISRCSRSKQPLSLIMCDIDFFKGFNDHLGHQQGDKALQKVAQCLHQQCKRPGDLTTRYGGEEFAIILPASYEDSTIAFIHLLQNAIEQLAIEHPTSDLSKFLTLSYGVHCCFPKKDTKAENLVLAADSALYIAKQNGRNQYKAFIEKAH